MSRTITNVEHRVDICIKCGEYLSVLDITRGICSVCRFITEVRSRERQAKSQLGPNVGLLVVLKRRISAALQRADGILRSRKIGEFNLTLSYLLDLYETQKGMCALSGRKLTLGAIKVGEYEKDVLSIDRKDPSKGYVIGNVQLVTYQINVAKSRCTNEEFIELCRNVVKKQGDAT